MTGGGGNVESTKAFKKNIVKIFDESGFKLNKLHSNVSVPEEEKDHEKIEADKTYAKQQLSKGDMKTTILGISLNKKDD